MGFRPPGSPADGQPPPTRPVDGRVSRSRPLPDGGHPENPNTGQDGPAELLRLQEGVPLPALVLDRPGLVRAANGAARRYLGLETDRNLEGAQFLSFVRKDWRGDVTEALETVIDGGGRVTLPRVGLVTLATEARYAYLAGTPTTYDQDDCALLLLKDDTELVETQRDLAEREAKFRSIAESSHDLIFRIDDEGRFSYLSPAAERLLGYAPTDLLGHELETVLAEPSIADAHEASDRIDSGEPIENLELRVVRKDGSERIVSVNGRPIEVGGEVVGTQGVARDVTERRERERRLERQNERLERFASVVSHDLRNPMSAAQGALELIEEEHDGPGVDILEQALWRMDELLADLLSLARDGRTVEDAEPVDLSRVCTQAWTTSDTDGGTLTIASEPAIRAEESRLRQLLENLFRNAIEHGQEDGPSGEAESATGPSVTVGSLAEGFYVADDGVGIDSDRRETVFEDGFSTSNRGTGYGLSIVREICQAHGWSISITESEAGGARFEITGVDVVERDGSQNDVSEDVVAGKEVFKEDVPGNDISENDASESDR